MAEQGGNKRHFSLSGRPTADDGLGRRARAGSNDSTGLPLSAGVLGPDLRLLPATVASPQLRRPEMAEIRQSRPRAHPHRHSGNGGLSRARYRPWSRLGPTCRKGPGSKSESLMAPDSYRRWSVFCLDSPEQQTQKPKLAPDRSTARIRTPRRRVRSPGGWRAMRRHTHKKIIWVGRLAAVNLKLNTKS